MDLLTELQSLRLQVKVLEEENRRLKTQYDLSGIRYPMYRPSTSAPPPFILIYNPIWCF